MAQAVDLEDIRLWRAPDHTRLVFDLSDAVQYQLFTLENPRRVVIDLQSTVRSDRFELPDFEGSPIVSLRTGVRNGADLRVVLDLDAEVKPNSFTLEPNAELSDRLVVDLYDLEPSPASADLARTPVRPEPVERPRRDIVIAISPGHGGEDPGTRSNDGRILEKDVVLALSRKLAASINAMPGYRAVLIRDGDYYVNLYRRPQIARDHRADLFLAIHADWFRYSRASGVTVYALSGERADRENAARVAQKENSADLLGGVGNDISLGSLEDDVALTLVSLQMEWSMDQSVVAGTQILESLGRVAKLRKDKVQQASFQVLNSPDIPSMLIETGYLSNATDAANLTSRTFQQNMADAIANGVRNYFYASPPPDSLVAWQKENGIVPRETVPREYVVMRGDSLSEIADRFGTTVAALRSENGLRSNTIRIGQTLTLPGGQAMESEHTIQRGETLSEIALRYGVSLSSLREANRLRSNDRILVGQVLKIPTL